MRGGRLLSGMSLDEISFPLFLDMIRLNEGANGCILSYPVSHEEIVSGYESIINREVLPDPKRALAIVSAAAYSISLPEYRNRGIGEDIAIETFKDISRWEEEYERMHGGEPGLSETGWLGYHLQLRIFALGSLQYQLRDQTDDIFTLALHIPKGSDISRESVQSSFDEAKRFFRKDRIRLVCSSWLLSEELYGLLDANSRIKAFSSMFTKTSSDYSRRQAEERIFGMIKENPAEYEGTTSRASTAREQLLRGGMLPVTSGYVII